MPPTFLLILLIIVAGLVSPVVLIGGIILAARPRTRRLGIGILVSGAAGACAAFLLDLLLNAAIGSHPSYGGAAGGAGAGFSVAAAGFVVWRWWRAYGVPKSAG